MRIELNGGDKLSFFQDLYEEARAYSEVTNEKLKKHFEQYRGSNVIDNSDVRALQVRNITYELVESQVTSYIPNPSVTPKRKSDRTERNAKSIETLLKNKRDELPFEKLNDIDERYNPIYGGSVWLIEWDNSITTHHSVGDVKISCLSPQRFVGQPNVYDIREMEYCFVIFETTKDEIVRKYGVSVELSEETESDTSADDKTATLYVCYYKNGADKVCEYVWSADTELLDIEDYYSRKRYVCRLCKKRKELCECEKPDYEMLNEDYEELGRDIPLSDGSVIPAMSPVVDGNGRALEETVKRQVLEEDGSPALEELENGSYLPLMLDVQVQKKAPTRLPFYTPNILPIVIRKNTSVEDSLLGQSDVEFIRYQQQAINKIESRIIEKVIRSGVYPLVPEDFRGELNNSVFGQVFRVNQSNAALYGRVDLQVDITRDIQQSERLYDQAKRILGISDSYQGQYDSSAKSGKAKQIQVQQAAGRLDSKRQMKNAAYAEIDEIIFQYYLAYADEPRHSTYRDENGNLQNLVFNRYDFIERDEAGEYYYDDGYLFRTDASMDVERNRELLWQENRLNFQSGAYGDPTTLVAQLIFWQNNERAHYPFAHDNVERLKAELERQRQAADMERQLLAAQSEVQSRKRYGDFLLGKNKELIGKLNTAKKNRHEDSF